MAYLLTWNCYGAWLPGDSRGAVDRLNNRYDTPRMPVDSNREDIARSAMKFAPYRLSPAGCAVVSQTVIDHSTLRGWKLHVVHPRLEHVHVVVSAFDYQPEIVLAQFKAWCTCRLRTARELDGDAPAWAEHGSTVYIWTREELARAVDYVANRQGERLG